MTGLVLPARGCGAAEAVELGRLGERLGYASVWVAEVASYDAIGVCCAVAATTERVTVGTAIVPVASRSPALMRMAASTLGSLAPGRAVLGVGSSTPTIVEGWHGRSSARPLEQMRALFDELDGTGRFRLDALEAPVRRFVGALRPRMRAFARERADGLLLNFAPRSSLARLAAEEQPDRPYQIALPIRTAVGKELGREERRFRREVASYFRVDVYRRWFTELGFGSLVERLAREEGLDEMAAALPEELVHELGVLAPPAGARAALAAIRADGVEPLVVPIVDPGDSESFVRIAEELAPDPEED